jgi:hypothetical protein
MPKKTAPKKKAESSSDGFGPPPPHVLADITGCLRELAEVIDENADELTGVAVEVPRFQKLGRERVHAVLASVPAVDEAILAKAASGELEFLVSEIATIARAVIDRLPRTTGPEQMAVILVGLSVMESVQEFMQEYGAEESQPPKQPKTDEVYQLKITLLNVEPTIWRRIQIRDCTLADLHYLIQAAMGWENAHLYEFQINRKRYSEPMEEDGGFGVDDVEDAAGMLLSEFVPEGRKQLKFKYWYDFGDDWWHEIRLEKRVTPDAKVEYPICREGEGACPPEDCGGPWGYLDKLEALADKDHPYHEEIAEWMGSDFDPTAFDPKKATKVLRKTAKYLDEEPGDDD